MLVLIPRHRRQHQRRRRLHQQLRRRHPQQIRRRRLRGQERFAESEERTKRGDETLRTQKTARRFRTGRDGDERVEENPPGVCAAQTLRRRDEAGPKHWVEIRGRDEEGSASSGFISSNISQGQSTNETNQRQNRIRATSTQIQTRRCPSWTQQHAETSAAQARFDGRQYQQTPAVGVEWESENQRGEQAETDEEADPGLRLWLIDYGDDDDDVWDWDFIF